MKEVWEGDTQPMGSPCPLPSHQGHPGTVFQESKPWTAIQMALAKWEGEAVGMPGIGEVRDPNPCPGRGVPEPSFHAADATRSSPSSWNPREAKGSQTGWIAMADGIPLLGNCNGSTSLSDQPKGVLTIPPQHRSVSALPTEGVPLGSAAPREKRRAEGLRASRPDCRA